VVQNFKKKICVIVDTLDGGGSERTAALLTSSLRSNYKVSIICIRDEVSYPYSGQLYNLGINEPKFKPFKQLIKLFKFRKYYKSIDADYYIDFRMRNRWYLELLLHWLVFNTAKTIFTIHSFEVFFHMPKHLWFFKRYNKAKAIVCVSKGIQDRMTTIFPFTNLLNIPNFLSSKNTTIAIPDHLPKSDYVIAVGRLNNYIKQFDRLILSYKNSSLYRDHVPLYIFGDGPDKIQLDQQIKELELESLVMLMGFRANILSYMKAAKFLILSSRLEGLPNVLLEALSVGTPLVSFDCPSGPSEIISDGINGILVAPQDFDALERAINKMYSDHVFYKRCKSNTLDSILAFSQDKVMEQWLMLLSS
jgi:N-acetylgalactosamine-N,N'-diacetylbacillosaminyl-diphospho-undecaprenol 4-alpha-N-acetylgalactosaminyltransferase